MALTKGTTFSDGGTVDAAGLNNLVDNATIDALAVDEAQLADGAVAADKLAVNSVQTLKIVDDAVQNSKLDNMAAKTVKANATNASANPTDVPIVTSELLAGTTTTINAVSITTDLEMADSSDVVVTDSTAAKIRVAGSLIDGKAALAPHTAITPASDTVLIYDADGSGNKLRQATVKDTVQSQVADTSTSGVLRLATTAKIIQPTGQSAASTDVLSVGSNSTVLPRAWGTIDYNKKYNTTDGTWSRLANFNLDNPSNSGYVISFVFSTPLDTGTSSYMIQTDAYYSSEDTPAADGADFLSAIGVVTARSNTGFDIRFRSYDGTNVVPYRINLIVYV
jgi:hypothetical protein